MGQDPNTGSSDIRDCRFLLDNLRRSRVDPNACRAYLSSVADHRRPLGSMKLHHVLSALVSAEPHA